MPIILLPFFPLATVLMGMVVVTSVKFTEFECADIVKDTLECDVCCCGCCCCEDVDYMLYDDSSDSFHAYAKKS
jgi:hypothetical protein